MNNFTKHITLFLMFFLLSNKFFAQFEISHIQDRYELGLQNFEKKQYQQALKEFLFIDTIKKTNIIKEQITDEIKYKIALCYLNDKNNNKEKFYAIPYLEKIIFKKYKFIPNHIYLKLADLYHQNYQFQRAIILLNYFQREKRIKRKEKIYTIRLIEICQNALKITKIKSIHIENLKKIGLPLDMIHIDYNPIILPDYNVMYFTTLNKNNSKEFKVSHKEIGIWKKPETITLNLLNEKDIDFISLAGVSFNGKTIFFKKKDKKEENIFFATIENGSFSKLKKLDANVNSKYEESKIFITEDGNEIYFSSDRPGGFGGKDLYKVVKKNEKWSKAINLGASINTAYDEDAPFIHTVTNTLYFSSKGHNSIGKFDVFKSKIKSNNNYEKVQNLGYPINTPQDNLSYVVSKSGELSYLTSVNKYDQDKREVFSIDLKSSVKKTMIKGNIFKEKTSLHSRINVFYKKKQEKYIYSPSYKQGKYLMIIPSGKEYSMFVSAKGFIPREIKIRVPNQTYFYEMFQEISFKPIYLLGKKLGEKLVVKNFFEDVYRDNLQKNEDKIKLKKVQKYRAALLENIKNITEQTETIGVKKVEKLLNETKKIEDVVEIDKDYDLLLNFLDQAIEGEDSTALNQLDETIIYDKTYKQTYFIPLNKKENNLQSVKINNKLMKVTQSLEAIADNTTKTELEKEDSENENKFSNKRKYIYNYSVFFDEGKSNFDGLFNKYSLNKDLKQIARFLINNNNLSVELQGYSDSKGDKIKNLKLSNERAKAIKNIFIEGMSSREIIFNKKEKLLIVPFGDSKSINEITEEDRKLNRRVDIKIFERI